MCVVKEDLLVEAKSLISDCPYARAAEFPTQEAEHLSSFDLDQKAWTFPEEELALSPCWEARRVCWKQLGALVDVLTQKRRGLADLRTVCLGCPLSPRASGQWRVQSTFRGALSTCASALYKCLHPTLDMQVCSVSAGSLSKQLHWQPRPVITDTEM